jgi:hypothetical protein
LAHGHGTGSHEEHQPASNFDAICPRRDISAAREDYTQAETVVQALEEARFPVAAIKVLDAAFVLRSATELHPRRGLLGRLRGYLGDHDYFAEQCASQDRSPERVVIHVPGETTPSAQASF